MNKQIFNFIWPVVRPYKWWMFLATIAPMVSSVFGLTFNYATKLLIDMTSSNTHITFAMGLKPVLCLLFGLLFIDIWWALHNLAQLKTKPFIARDLTNKIFVHVLKHDYSYFANIHSGSIISKIKGIGDGWWNTWGWIEFKLTEPLFKMIFFSITLIFINIKLFLIFVVFLITVFPISYFLYRKSGKLNEKDKNNLYKAMGFMSDKITNIFSVLSFSKKNHEMNNLYKFYEEEAVPVSKAFFKQNMINQISLIVPYYSMIISMFVMTIILYNSGEITAGDIAFTLMTSFTLVDCVFTINQNMNDMINHLGDLRASFSIIMDPITKQDKNNAVPIIIDKGEIEFKNINISYDDKNIIEGLNLHIKAGQRVGLVGPSGAGKSTLINILMRYFAINNGQILIDGQNIANITQDSLRSQISLIPQESMLFHVSIGQNIGYAKEHSTMKEIIEAAQMANIHDFINTLPEKYDTLVGERGVKLSGGQRQRIAIARAILKKAPILILDEATSSLDSLTEQEIQKSINTMLNASKATVIAIAHRLSTIKHLDRIIVLDKGKIIEDGTFSELIEKDNGKFKDLWDRQTYS